MFPNQGWKKVPCNEALFAEITLLCKFKTTSEPLIRNKKFVNVSKLDEAVSKPPSLQRMQHSHSKHTVKLLHEVCLVFVQRMDHVTCRPDALAPDPMKQNTLCMSYLLGEWVEKCLCWVFFFHLWFICLSLSLCVLALQTHLRRSLWASFPLSWSLVQTLPSTKPWSSPKSVLTFPLQWGTLFDKSIKSFHLSDYWEWGFISVWLTQVWWQH